MAAALPVGAAAGVMPAANGPPYEARANESRGHFRQNRGRGRGGYDHGANHGHGKNMNGQGSANRGNKRTHANAFQPHAQQPSALRSTAAALPVPSFGLPLPSRPPVAADANRKSNKRKKRKHNQLGLTPRSYDHESTSSDDDDNDNEDEDEDHDVDEESKLTKDLTTVTTAPLQFTYKGRTSKLQSSADIQAWIEERKKKFPTRARIEEKKKEEEAKKAKLDEAKKARQEERETRQEENKERREKIRAEKAHNINPADAAAKAKLKAEKLRKKLLREEAKVAKAEADAQRANQLLHQAEASAAENNIDTAEKTASALSGGVPLTQPETGTSNQESSSNVEREKSPSSALLDKVEAALSGAPVDADVSATAGADGHNGTSLPPPTEQGAMLADEDWTSSSGSDSSSLSSLDDSDDDDDDDDNDEDDDDNDDDVEMSDTDSNLANIEVDAATEMVNAASATTATTAITTTTTNGTSESVGQDNDEDSDSAPDQSTSKRTGPERVLPPARKAGANPSTQDGKTGKSTQKCKQYLKYGQCQRGQACKFLHERQTKANGVANGAASQRKSLFQIVRALPLDIHFNFSAYNIAYNSNCNSSSDEKIICLFQQLLEKEKENEDKRIMDAIIYLGQHGILDQPASTTPVEGTETGLTE